MWKSNYNHDEWERRKTYLIRSLFQDIPVLSPVPEEQEPRYGAGSPSDIPPERPYSPLPPLIIEWMPNKHDHPPEFYEELERKMKKVYKKLFLDEEKSSDEELIERRADNKAASSLNQDLEDFGGADLCASASTVKLHKTTSLDQSSLENISPERMASDRNFNKSSGGVNLTQSSKTDSSNSVQSRDVQSSPQSLCGIQFITVAEVHNELSNQDKTPLSLHEDIYNSPVLEYRRLAFNTTLLQNEKCHEEEAGEELDEQISGTETSGSEKDYSNGGDKEKSGGISSSDTSYRSTEIMRKQKHMSPSLGSLQDEAIPSLSSKRSSTCPDAALHQNLSLDLAEENHSNCDQRSLSSSSLDVNNILTTSTPKLLRHLMTKSSTQSSGNDKRLRSESSDINTESSSILITKRRKYENQAIQTSFTCESDVDDVTWNQLKTNLFMGVPKIYKLCQCKDHACRNSNNK